MRDGKLGDAFDSLAETVAARISADELASIHLRFAELGEDGSG